VSLPEFNQLCDCEVRARNAAAAQAGVNFPEVVWPEVVRAAIPEVRSWSESELDEFLFRHEQLIRTVTLMGGAAGVLPVLAGLGLKLGLCSNCQLYTLRELTSALKCEGLSLELFDPHLRFFSFQAGFSKPNPEAFRGLGQALAALGIAPAATIMVGDRVDNDIAPARAQGWVAWHLQEIGGKGEAGGTWNDLLAWILALV
jgi:putative hydrolase of the HAD superfamily